MKYALSPLAFTLGASAAVLKRSDCCFELSASGSGDATGTLGQLSDGQNRVGGDYSPAKYCINQSGGITDSNGRGCILTPPTTQFQCDEGASPTTGFSIGSGGEVTYNGSTQFYACPADDGEYNIYTKPVEGQDKCVEITLSTDGKCAAASTPAASTPAPVASTPVASAPPASTPVASAPPVSTPVASAPPASTPVASAPPASTPEDVTQTLTQTTTECSTTGSTPAPSAPAPSAPVPESSPAQSVTVPASSAPTPEASQPQPSTPAATPTGSSEGGCPTNLDGDYQYPHLIVPVNSSAPTDSYGTQYNGEIRSDDVCSLFNFDIPADWTEGTCSVLFLLPQKDELETSDYDLTGNGGEAVFKELSAPADKTTTWDSVPESKGDLGSWAIDAGKRFVVKSVECSAIADQTIGYEVCAQGGLELEWFQDWNPSPIGLFVRKC